MRWTDDQYEDVQRWIEEKIKESVTVSAEVKGTSIKVTLLFNGTAFSETSLQLPRVPEQKLGPLPERTEEDLEKTRLFLEKIGGKKQNSLADAVSYLYTDLDGRVVDQRPFKAF